MVIEQVHVTEVMRLLAPASGGSWAEVAARLQTNPSSAARIEELTAELRATGRYGRPVVYAQIGDVFRVIEGMHRVIAAQALGGCLDLVEAVPSAAGAVETSAA